MATRSKMIWYTDLHLNRVSLFNKLKFIYHINKEKPSALFLTGDTTNGLWLNFDFTLLAKFIKCPIYFVLGNHEYNFSSFKDTHEKIRKLCKKYPNLIWLDESEVIELNNKSCVLGHTGWYDCSMGNEKLLTLTTDWFLIKELKNLSNMAIRIEKFKSLADDSCKVILANLNKAVEIGYKTIYILTHFPVRKEATRDQNTLLEAFWIPYNTNIRLGKTIKNFVKENKDINVICLSGHIHQGNNIMVNNRFQHIVAENNGSYFGPIKHGNIFYI